MNIRRDYPDVGETLTKAERSPFVLGHGVAEPLAGPTRLALDLIETRGGIAFRERCCRTGATIATGVIQ